MSILAFILLINFVLLIFLAVKVSLLDTSVVLYKLAGFTMLVTASLSLVELGIMLVGNMENIVFFTQVSQTLQLIMIYFSVVCTSFFWKPKSKSKLNLVKMGLIIMGLSMFILIVNIISGSFSMIINIKKIQDIWYHQIETEGFPILFFYSWVFISAIVLNFSFLSAYRSETNQSKKNWIFYLSILQFGIAGSMIFIFLFYSQDAYVPFLTSIPFSVSAVLMSVTYSNFQLFKINPVSAFDNIVENMSNLVIITDVNFQINFINKTAVEYLGIPKEKLQNRPIDFLKKSIDKESIDRLKEQCAHLNNNDFFQEEIILMLQNRQHHFQFTFSPIYNKQNQKTGYLLLGNDLTYYKSSTAQLLQQTQMLEESNMELERFAYIASHDLKTPLRNVVSFLNLTERKIAKYEDQELEDFIKMAKQGADQMYNLIQDVLEYSKLKKISETPQVINLNNVLSKVINNLGDVLYKNNIDLSVDHLPVIKAQEAHIIQVFQNLIENGLRYNQDENPTVHVIYHQLENQHLFEVKDNGIGIAPQYQQKIFEMFKRLHNASEYQGSGIGLAICKKIIQDNGGRIWLTSEDGKGSSFFFSWPLSKTKPKESMQMKLALQE